jgi:4-carboxymuconolactone decarboxylase
MADSAPTQENTAPTFELRGHRFKPLTWETMSEAQQAMTRAVLSGKRGAMQGPYNVLLRSPVVGNLAQQFGAQTRFDSSLPLALNELAILMMARHWTAQFVWWAHRTIAEQAGLPADLVQCIAQGRDAPKGLAPEVSAVYRFCRELIDQRQVSDVTYADAVAHFGERGVVDLMATLGYYTLVCMSLNVDQYPLPDGAQPELKPLA